MIVTQYKKIALDWQPDASSSRDFNRILWLAMVVVVIVLAPLSFIKVPAETNHKRVNPPERVADFISKKEKPPAPKAPPKPLPPPPPPPKPVEKVVETPSAITEVTKQRDLERKPLTESQMKARKTAEKSGLLALSNELNDLVDTKDVSANLSKKLNADTAGVNSANTAAGHNTDAITAGVAQTGGKVDGQAYGGVNSKTELDGRAANKDLADRKAQAEAKVAATKAKGGMSAEENVTMVFDKNKGALYSLYERERRNSQGLQGKIVLQITISPAGDVTDVKILSSELNSPELEARIVSRVKGFKFTVDGTKPITVTYPIEFLPS
jgi:TonB family protein